MKDYSEYSTYLLLKTYLRDSDKESNKAKEIEELLVEDLNLSNEADFSTLEIKNLITKFYYDKKRKHEKFVNISAWIFIVLSGLGLLGAIHTAIFLELTSNKNPIFDRLYSGELNPIFEFYIQHPLLFYFLSLFLLFSVFFSFIGVLNRSNFARKIVVVLLGFKIIQNLAEPLLVKFIYPRAHNFAVDIPKTYANLMYQSSIAMSLLISIIFVIIYGWLIYKYTDRDIISEFT